MEVNLTSSWCKLGIVLFSSFSSNNLRRQLYFFTFFPWVKFQMCINTIQRSADLVCLNKQASWIGYEANKLLKDPVWTWDLILVKESVPLTPAVTAGWGIADQFISPSLSLNERTSTILLFQSLTKTSKYWSGRETLPLRETVPSVFPWTLYPRAGCDLRHSWLSERCEVSVGGLTQGRWRKWARLYLPNALLFEC